MDVYDLYNLVIYGVRMLMASNFTATFSFVCLSRPCQTCTTCCVCQTKTRAICCKLSKCHIMSHPKPLQSSLNTQNWQSGELLLTGMEQYNKKKREQSSQRCQIFTFASCKLRSEPAPSFFSIWYRPFATVEGGFEPEHGTARHGTTRHDIGEVRSFLSSPVSSLQVHHFQSFVVCTKPQNSLEVKHPTKHPTKHVLWMVHSWYISCFFMVFFMAHLSHFGHSSAGSEVAADKGFARCDR